MTAKMCGCHDNCHQKITAPPITKPGLRATNSCSGDQPQYVELEEWPQDRLEEGPAAKECGLQRLRIGRGSIWRRPKAVIESHQQGSDHQRGQCWDTNVFLKWGQATCSSAILG